MILKYQISAPKYTISHHQHAFTKHTNQHQLLTLLNEGIITSNND